MKKIELSFNKNARAGADATSKDKAKFLFDTDEKALYREDGEKVTKENLSEDERVIFESFLKHNKKAYKNPQEHPIASSPDGTPVEGKDPALAGFMIQLGYDTVCLIEELLAE